jgi:hypothetical protein
MELSGLEYSDALHMLVHCDLPTSAFGDLGLVQRLRVKGLWRVDADK